MKALLKILNKPQTQLADSYTIKHQKITSIELMEKASISFVNAITPHLEKKLKIAVVCGVGNNGGDGFVVARLLQTKGYNVQPYLVQFKNNLSPDCEANYKKLDNVIIVSAFDEIPNFSNYNVIIDAIFGSGLSKPITGFVKLVIDGINKTNADIYSIDCPSGLQCDKLFDSESIIQSDITISFQRPKLSFFFPENADYVKNWKVVDIGLEESFIQQQESNYYVLNENISCSLKPRPRQSHKGSYGHSLLIAGSYGKMGAALLSAKACLRSGVGLLTTYIPKCGYTIMQMAVPEAMCLTDKNEQTITQLPDISKYSSIGIGPGLGTNIKTATVLKQLLKQSNVPIVLDADAINIISQQEDLKTLIPSNTILTPHIKEFDRLAGKSLNSLERFQRQQNFSIKYNCIVVLKNAYTCISSPKGNLYFNTSGNQGMATGGSGDVLTGIITSLLAQNYTPLEAALIGVFYHGKAGDNAANYKGYNALIASDIINSLKI